MPAYQALGDAHCHAHARAIAVSGAFGSLVARTPLSRGSGALIERPPLDESAPLEAAAHERFAAEWGSRPTPLVRCGRR